MAAFMEAATIIIRKRVRRLGAGRPPEDLEDVIASARLHALKGALSCTARRRVDVLGWLKTIARRRFNEYLRTCYDDTVVLTEDTPEGRVESVEPSLCTKLVDRREELLDAAADGAAHLARTGQPAELAGVRRAALTRKPSTMRRQFDVYLASCLDEESHRTLAARFNVSKNTVDIWVSRARTALRLGLGARHLGHPPVDDPHLRDLIEALVTGSLLEEGC